MDEVQRIATDRDEDVEDTSQAEEKVKFKHYYIPLTQEDAERLTAKLDAYLRENSILVGFFNDFLKDD